MTTQKPMSDAEIEAAMRADLPWLLERSRAREAAIKSAVLELVDDLPHDATWEDVMYSVYVREAIEAGRRDAAEGRLVDLAEVRRRFGLAGI